MSGRLLAGDPFTKSDTRFHADGDEFVVESRQDVEPVIERNKRAFRNADRSYRDRDFHHVASIPTVVWFRLKKEGIADDPKRLKAWLNDRDNRLFRTKPGVV